MATKFVKPMKKHQACYHLNNIIREKKDELKFQKEKADSAKEGPPENVDRMVRWSNEAIERLTAEIEALDIAASNLTKN